MLGETRGRLIALVAVVIGLMLVPASAQADPVDAEDCTAQVTAVEGEDEAFFTLTCDEQGIEGARFSTSEGAVIPGFQGEEPPPHGLLCEASGSPENPEFTCGGQLDPGEVGTAQIGTQDPCGNNFTVQNLELDTFEGSPESPEFESDVQFQEDVQVQCEGGDTAGGEGGSGDGGGDGGGGDANDECVEGGDTEHRNQDRETGEFEGQHVHSTEEGDECDFPRGGVDSGGGGDAEASSLGGGPGNLPLAIGGASLVLLGLLGGGLTLARR